MKTRLGMVVLSVVVATLGLVWSVTAHELDRQPSAARMSPTQPEFVPGEVLVKLHDGVTLSPQPDHSLAANRSTLSAALLRIGAQHVTSVFASDAPIELQQVYRLKISGDVAAAVKELAADPNVEYAEPNYLARAAIVPNDPLYSSQWALDKINAPAAWEVVTGTPGVVIAIIDSGVDTAHPDLVGRLWVNPGEIPGNGIDDDNNGYIDDVNGWNFVGGNNTVSDDNGHGTQVAGVAGAATDNAIGIAGLCWNCRLMIVKAMQAGGVANYSDIAAAVNYAAAKGAQVINLSLGGYADSATVRAAIDAASSSAVIVGGAGNDNVSTPFYPAAYPNVLSVASTTISDTKASFSNYGSWINVAAPGVAIYTTFSGGDYGTGEGTSLSAPLVSGLAGLIKSAHPDWSSALVRAQIIHTTDAFTETQLGSGRIDGQSALTTAPTPQLSMANYSANGALDGNANPGTTVNLDVTILNNWADITNVSGILTTSDAYVSITNATSSFGNIDALANGTNSSPFVFSVSGSAPSGYNISFTLSLSANDGAYTTNLTFAVPTQKGIQSVGGIISSNQTWTHDKTYIMTGNTLVQNGVVLTIEPGTTISFTTGGQYLQVDGTLIASGTAQSPIVFTEGGCGIRFTDSSTDYDPVTHVGSVVGYTVFEGIGFVPPGPDTRCSQCYHRSAIEIQNASPLITHNFLNVAGKESTPWCVEGIQAYGTTSEISYNSVVGAADSGLMATGNPTVIHNTITRSGAGACAASGDGIWRWNHFIGPIYVSWFNGAFCPSPSTIVEYNLFENVLSPFRDPGASTILSNTFFGYDFGFRPQGGPPTVTLTGNNFVGNTNSKVIVSENTSVSMTFTAENNYWGTTNPSDIANMIWDQTDDFNNKTLVHFEPFLSAPSPDAPGFLYDLSLSPVSPIGIQQATFVLTFSRSMDQSFNPVVTFGATAPYTSFVVSDNAQWVSDHGWRATYDITSLVPRGTYTISVSGANGTDGMPIPTDTHFGFTVDYAGSITDQTPPPTPQVTACSAATVSTLSARWIAYDPQSAITLYRYAVGATPGGSDVVNWTTTPATSIVRNSLNLLTGQTYYVSVQARNAGGLWSPAASSSGVVAGVGGCPTADFNATPTSGRAPLNVDFTDVSSGTITSRLWDFGDGVTSTLLSPLHLYTATGTYTVSLQIAGPGGSDNLTRIGYISVTEPISPPVAAFDALPHSGPVPLVVNFVDHSTGSVTEWLWQFGDGLTSTLKSPTHTYQATGNFDVTLSVIGPNGTDALMKPAFISVTHEFQLYLPLVRK